VTMDRRDFLSVGGRTLTLTIAGGVAGPQRTLALGRSSVAEGGMEGRVRKSSRRTTARETIAPGPKLTRRPPSGSQARCGPHADTGWLSRSGQLGDGSRTARLVPTLVTF
jgi:hypothetical protein